MPKLEVAAVRFVKKRTLSSLKKHMHFQIQIFYTLSHKFHPMAVPISRFRTRLSQNMSTTSIRFGERQLVPADNSFLRTTRSRGQPVPGQPVPEDNSFPGTTHSQELFPRACSQLLDQILYVPVSWSYTALFLSLKQKSLSNSLHCYLSSHQSFTLTTFFPLPFDYLLLLFFLCFLSFYLYS